VSEKNCPYLKEADVLECCDFEDMFGRPPTDEDCRYCLASLAGRFRRESEWWEGRYKDLATTLQREGVRLLQLLNALQRHESLTTTKLRSLIRPHPEPHQLRKLLRLLPVESIRVGGGRRWRLVK